MASMWSIAAACSAAAAPAAALWAVGGAHVDPIVLTLQGPLHGMPAASIVILRHGAIAPVGRARPAQPLCGRSARGLSCAGAAIDAAGAAKPYRGALRGPHMVDGTESGKSEYLERLDAEARARLTPEDWERAARLNSMPLEELDEIGEKEDEERRWKERFAEIP